MVRPTAKPLQTGCRRAIAKAAARGRATDLEALPLGKSGDLAVGQPVVAIGNALALTGGPTATEGIVSALDRSIDAGALLALTRTHAHERGVVFHDQHTLVGHGAGDESIALRFKTADGSTRDVVARIMIAARGAASPYATADLLCPTVGGVLTGLEAGDGPQQMNPRVGDILVTTDDVEDGRQHIWEAFPGRPGEVTVYLFYYARAEDVGPGALTRHRRRPAQHHDHRHAALLDRLDEGLAPHEHEGAELVLTTREQVDERKLHHRLPSRRPR